MNHGASTWNFFTLFVMMYYFVFVFFVFVINRKYFIIYIVYLVYVLTSATGWAIFLPILVQLARNLQKMFLGDVSSTSTNHLFFIRVIKCYYLLFSDACDWIHIVSLLFGDISPICSTGRAIFSPILVQMAWKLQGMLLRGVSTTSTRIFSIRMFKVNISRFAFHVLQNRKF